MSKAYLSVTGPQQACFGNTYTYTAQATGILIKCEYWWSVEKDGVTILGPYVSNSNTFNYTPDYNTTGWVLVKCTLDHGIYCIDYSSGAEMVNVGYPPTAITGPTSMTNSSTNTFSTSYSCISGGHGYSFKWTAPPGWLINGQPSPVTTSSSVSITTPSTGSGPNQISVQGVSHMGTLTQMQTLNVQLGTYLPPVGGNIAGPTVAAYYQYCSWTMNPTGGNGTYSYAWRRSVNYGSTWSGVVSTSKTYSAYAFDAASTNPFLYLQCTVTSGYRVSAFQTSVECTDCSFGYSSFSAIEPQDVESPVEENGKLLRTKMQPIHEDNVLTIFPNPTSKSLSISKDMLRKENAVTIVNSMGEAVFKSIIYPEEHTIDVSHLLPGYYYLILTNSEGRWLQKLQINR